MNQNRLITAFFDDRAEAQRAVDRLAQAGIPRADIHLIENSDSSSSTASSPAAGSIASGAVASGSYSTSSSYEGSGFWSSLSNLFMPDEDRDTYAEGLRRGGYLVSLHVLDVQYDRALDILDDEGTVDLDQRSESWRSEGWQSPRTQTAAGASSGAGLGATGTRGAGMAAVSPSSGTGAQQQSGAAVGRDEVIPVVQENLRVGKRDVSHGRVRVRSYVRETPVQEQVDLRREHVDVQRRPVDRPLGAGDAAFRERTVEATERAEEPVVSKEARVVEEVSLRKEADTRRETVSDKVRKTEVEVEDERTGRATGTGVPGSPKRPL